MNQPADAPFKADFKLSITKALADQLAEKLDTLQPYPLTKNAIDLLERRSGVYLLWYQNRRVYVGKAQQPLPVRLFNHWNKLRGRRNLSIDEVKFVCLYVDEDFDAAAPEKLLIKMYRSEQRGDRAVNGVPWNTNGFGNKDPGKQRDGSAVEENHFDAVFPIRLDFADLELPVGPTEIGVLLAHVKSKLPYNLRFDKKSERARKDYKTLVDVPAAPLSMEQVISLIVRALPEGWQVTALPGYLILYFEKEGRVYPSALRWWRRLGEAVVATDHVATLAPVSEIQESDDGSNTQDDYGD